MDPHQTTVLVLVRHGETDWNKEHRMQGQLQPGPPLNALGERQADVLAAALTAQSTPFHALYCSDLLRTVQTAAAITQALSQQTGGTPPPVLLTPQLRERHVGVLHGRTYEEAAEQLPEAWAALRRGGRAVAVQGGGESLNDMSRRVVAEIERIASENPGRRVLVVTHGGVLQEVHRHVRGHGSDRLINCSLSVLHVQGSKWAVVSWNSADHLARAGCDMRGSGGGAGEA